MGHRERLISDKSYAKYLFFDSEIKKEDYSNEFRIAILRNYTVEILVPVLRGEVALQSTFPDVYVGEYDNVLQEVMQRESSLYTFNPDVINVSICLQNLSPKLTHEYTSLSYAQIIDEVDRIRNFYANVIGAVRENTNAAVLIENLYREPVACAGILDYQLKTAEKNIVEELNKAIYDLAIQHENVYVVDVNSIIYELGYKNAVDYQAWDKSKNPFSKEMLVSLGQEYMQYYSVLLGKMKKCIVLDCDNTLWGGIVGEDGPYGIQIGDDYPGIAYKHFQQEIIHLKNRGVIIALCSKNNEQDVWEVFDSNTNMVLSKDDIVAFEINWDSKAENIKKIAERINIGLDSIVFVDDSHFECELVRNQLPEVEVIQLGKNISENASLIRRCRLFSSLTLTEDDKNRNATYKAEQVRKNLQAKYSTMDEYLSSLNMKATIRRNMQEDVPRIAQMTQKTNQFNLTTRRYTESDIIGYIDSGSADVISIKLADDISDMGIIGAAIIFYKDKIALIDSFLLSCRALGRRIEDVLYGYVVQQAKKRHCVALQGEYIRTKKNKQVEDLYERFGMNKLSCKSNDIVIWQTDSFEFKKPEFITVLEV